MGPNRSRSCPRSGAAPAASQNANAQMAIAQVLEYFIMLALLPIHAPGTCCLPRIYGRPEKHRLQAYQRPFSAVNRQQSREVSQVGSCFAAGPSWQDLLVPTRARTPVPQAE